MAIYTGKSSGDSLSGGDGDDFISGLEGNDTLYGGKGGDTLVGGPGDDTLNGGYGANVAVFSGNFADYTITYDSTASAFTVVDSVASRDGTDAVSSVEWFQFADVTKAAASLMPPTGNETLTGTAASDLLDGGLGHDMLNGMAGDDTLIGGLGNDYLDGGAGVDTAVFSGNFADYAITYRSFDNAYQIVDGVGGRDGADTAWNIEWYQFADGVRNRSMQIPVSTVTSPGNDSITASGADSLSGAAGNDSLYGSRGDDTLNGGSGDDYLSGNLGNDLAVFTGNASEYTISYEGAGRYKVIDNVAGRDGTDILDIMEYVQFADGTRNLSDFGPPVNKVLSGTSGSDLLIGGAGDDSLYGGKGMDTLIGEGGNDLLQDGYVAVFSGNFADYDISFDAQTNTYTVADRVSGRDGTDRARGIVYFQFADGQRDSAMQPPPSTTTSPGNDWITGTEAADNLRGDAGDDTLYGSKADDTLTGGSGNDVLDGGNGYDTAVFSGNFSEYSVTQDGAAGILTFVDHVNDRDGTDTTTGVELFQFADGLRNAAFQLLPSSRTSPGDDSIWGSNGADYLSGAAGNDTLYGSKGDDTLEGGTGNDMLDGAEGSDTAVFSGAFTEYVVSFDGSRYTVRDRSAGRDGTDSVANVEFFQFADGARSADQLIPRDGPPPPPPPPPSGKSLSGTAASDSLVGTGQDDTLSGGNGNDTLDGGLGNDVLEGGAGRDVAVYAGSRSQYIVTSAGTGVGVADGGRGTDTLSGVERLRFDDMQVALDLEGSAGEVAKALGVLFGSASVGNKVFVGIGLQLLDAGLGFEALLDFGLHAVLGEAPANAEVVDLLYQNVVEIAPPPDVRANFVALLEQGVYTQTSLALLAANHQLNLANINFTGLAATGLEYV